MIEIIAVMAIMGIGIAALLETIGGGIRLASDTENNIKAINIAREGIEGVINIRDTNWLRYSSDKTNCWRTKEYNSDCIGNPGSASLLNSGSYSLYSQYGLWYLSGISSPPVFSTNWQAYKNTFSVVQDTQGFYTQTGVVSTKNCTTSVYTGCITPFTREISLNIIGTGTMTVKSIVRWKERRDRQVILETTLTNWKSKF